MDADLKALLTTKWAKMAAALLALVLARCSVSAAARTGGMLSELEPTQGKGGPLIVVLHGMSGRRKLDPVLDALKAEPALVGASYLAPAYAAHAWVNAAPAKIADNLRRTISRAAAGSPGRDIVLLGYSAGGVFLRQAYLDGLSKGEVWAEHVKRIVLLAGLNRGWHEDTLVGAPRALVIAARTAFPLFGIGQLYDELHRGSPFIGGLRLRWIETMRKRRAQKQPVASVVQLRGEVDEIALRTDTADLSDATPYLELEPLPNTTHASLLDFSGPLGADRRQQIVEQVVRYREPLPVPAQSFEACDGEVNTSVKHALIAVHGMRTSGGWAATFVEEFNGRHDAALRATLVDYDWLPMVPFLLTHERREHLHFFIDKYTQVRACCPNLESVSVVAHSNGSYIVAHALKEVREIRLENLATVGTVLPSDFRWSDLSRRVQRIANYRGNKDWIVGIFPNVFEFLPWGDMGGAGFWKFTEADPRLWQPAYFPGGHSEIVEDGTARAAIAAFLAFGDKEPTLKLRRAEQAGLVLALSRMCLLVWVLLIVVMVGAGYWLWSWRARSEGPRRTAALLCFCAYVTGVLAVGLAY